MTNMIIVDVETCGPSPYSGEMTEFGAVALNKSMTAIQSTFHGKLIDAIPDPENPAIPLIQSDSKRYNEKEVMLEFVENGQNRFRLFKELETQHVLDGIHCRLQSHF